MQRFLHSMSAWLRDWKPYFKSRLRQLLSNWWEIIAGVSLAVLVFSATLGALLLLRPDISGTLEALNAVFTLIALEIALYIFGFSFVLLFILSLHPKTRRIADRLFHFKDLTELEELKVRVGNVENGLHSTNGRVESIDKQLEEINSRLGSIEATLKSLASKDSQKEGDKE